MRKAAIAIAFIAFNSYALALDCNNAMTDPEMYQCAGKDLAAADKKLNQTYGRLMSLLDNEGQKKLKEAQRAWLKFRDANADFAGDLNRGGTLERLNFLGAKANMTNARVEELDSEIESRK